MRRAEMQPLAPGWERVTFGDVAQYVNGYAFKPEDWQEHGTPIIRIAQMHDPAAPCDFYRGSVPAKHCIDDGDLLFSWSATLMALIWDRGPAFLNQHIFKVVPKAGTDQRFLHQLLNYSMDVTCPGKIGPAET